MKEIIEGCVNRRFCGMDWEVFIFIRWLGGWENQVERLCLAFNRLRGWSCGGVCDFCCFLDYLVRDVIARLTDVHLTTGTWDLVNFWFLSLKLPVIFGSELGSHFVGFCMVRMFFFSEAWRCDHRSFEYMAGRLCVLLFFGTTLGDSSFCYSADNPQGLAISSGNKLHVL